MSLVSLAMQIASRAHSGLCRRDGGTPYITHPAAVAARLAGESDEVVATAWLHDVIEDTDETPESLRAAGVPAPVVRAVEVLTKPKGGMDYGDYLRGVRQNPIARKVKVADMLANLSDQPTKRQIVKYARGLLILCEESPES